MREEDGQKTQGELNSTHHTGTSQNSLHQLTPGAQEKD